MSNCVMPRLNFAKKTTSTVAGVTALAALLMLASLGFCQTSPREATFEVASVKAVNPGGLELPPFLVERMLFQGGPGTEDPGRINYSGVTMRMLLRRAYSLRADQIVGPGWMDEQHYEIKANVPYGSDDQLVRLMLRSLLTERFQIQFHREMKTVPIYALAAAKGGPKLQAGKIPPTDPKGLAEEQRKQRARAAARRPGEQRFGLANASIAEFIEVISPNVDRPVLDQTQLQGKFAFNFSYFRILPGQDDPSGPSVFAALKEQLGLELKPTKGEVELW